MQVLDSDPDLWEESYVIKLPIELTEPSNGTDES